MKRFINILSATVCNSRQKTWASQSLKEGFNNFKNCIWKRVFNRSICILSSRFSPVKTAPTILSLRPIFMRGFPCNDWVSPLVTQTWLVDYLYFVLSPTHKNFGRYQYAYSLIALFHQRVFHLIAFSLKFEAE